MRKLLKNILSYGLWLGEIPKDLSVLHKRTEEVSEPPAAKASIRSGSGPSSFFLKVPFSSP